MTQTANRYRHVLCISVRSTQPVYEKAIASTLPRSATTVPREREREGGRERERGGGERERKTETERQRETETERQR